MNPRRGSAPAFLLATLVLSCATGIGVYLYLKDHYAHAITDVPGSDQVVGLSFSYKPRPK